MGNDLRLIVIEDNKVRDLANLGRKHNFMINGMGSDMPSTSEIEKELSQCREDLLYDIIDMHTSKDLGDPIEKLKYNIERLHDLSYLAGKISVVNDLQDEYSGENLMVLDDFELERLEIKAKNEPNRNI